MRKEESVSKETIEFWFYEEKNIMIKVKDVTIKSYCATAKKWFDSKSKETTKV